MKALRRSLFKRFFSPLTSLAGVGMASESMTKAASNPTIQHPVQDVPLYSGITRQGNLLFVQGIGAHFNGDARAHADHI